MNILKTKYLVINILFLFSFYLNTNAQKPRKIFNYLQDNQLNLAIEEYNKIVSNKEYDNEDEVLFTYAKCLFQIDTNYQKYNPIQSLKDFNGTYIQSDIKESIYKFLGKYSLSPKIIYDKINYEAYKNAFIINNVETYKKTFDVVSSNYKEAVELKLFNTIFKNVRKSQNIDEINYIIKIYPKSEYIQETIDLRDSIVFTKISLENKPKSFFSFLTEYPNSKFITIAKIKIDSLNFISFKQAINSNSILNLQNYIETYKNGTNVDLAKKILDSNLVEICLLNHEIDSLIDFYTKNSKNQYIEKVLNKIISLFISNQQYHSIYELYEKCKIVKDKNYIENILINLYNLEPPIDADGYVYKTINIGNQLWFAENLNTTRYNDGTLIPNIEENDKWSDFKSGAWCYYDNNPSNKLIYGKLYNWMVVNNNVNICPTGWHVPTNEDWNELIFYLGGDNITGRVIKAKEFDGYFTDKLLRNILNDDGFNAVPSGSRDSQGYYSGTRQDCEFWSSSINSIETHALSQKLFRDASKLYTNASNFSKGLSIRCLSNFRGTKDDELNKILFSLTKSIYKSDTNIIQIEKGAMDIDRNIYKSVKIGKQEWLAENLTTTRYNDGTLIQNVKDRERWDMFGIGAWCYYENDELNNGMFGKLYNSFVVNNDKNVCPIGWHIPSFYEWIVLKEFIGGDEIAGGKMKKYKNSSWNIKYIDSLNNCYFNALPSGFRNKTNQKEDFIMKNKATAWWCKPLDIRALANRHYNIITNDENKIYEVWDYENTSMPIRCIKD